MQNSDQIYTLSIKVVGPFYSSEKWHAACQVQPASATLPQENNEWPDKCHKYPKTKRQNLLTQQSCSFLYGMRKTAMGHSTTHPANHWVCIPCSKKILWRCQNLFPVTCQGSPAPMMSNIQTSRTTSSSAKQSLPHFWLGWKFIPCHWHSTQEGHQLVTCQIHCSPLLCLFIHLQCTLLPLHSWPGQCLLGNQMPHSEVRNLPQPALGLPIASTNSASFKVHGHNPSAGCLLGLRESKPAARIIKLVINRSRQSNWFKVKPLLLCGLWGCKHRN